MKKYIMVAPIILLFILLLSICMTLKTELNKYEKIKLIGMYQNNSLENPVQDFITMT